VVHGELASRVVHHGTFRHAVPPLPGAESDRCSVTRLTRCLSLQLPRHPVLRPVTAGYSELGWDAPSTRPRWPHRQSHDRTFLPPARVTDGHYTTQLLDVVALLLYIHPALYFAKQYGRIGSTAEYGNKGVPALDCMACFSWLECCT